MGELAVKVGAQPYKLTRGQREALVEYLQGTTKSINEAMEQLFGPHASEDDLTHRDYEAIDEAIFECETCGWWCERSEESEEEECVCDDCA